jgi:hypothetical protein
MKRLALAIGLLLVSMSGADAACGERGGPGFRAPNGKCVAWDQIGRVCGHPPETRCKREGEADGARAVAEAQETARTALRPGDQAKATVFGLMSAAEPALAEGGGEPLDPDTTRILDGDTIEIGAEHKRVRLVGFNAPETQGASCARERALGLRATARVIELLDSGPATLQIVPCGMPGRNRGHESVQLWPQMRGDGD